MASEWSNILRDVLEYIQTKLDLSDVLRCRSVCREWRNLTRYIISSSLNSPPQQPLLLWDNNYDFDDHCFSYSFLDVTSPGTNLYHLNPKSKLLLNRNMGECVGYSHGWFLFLDLETQTRLRLFHPLLFSSVDASFPLISTPCGNIPRRIRSAVLTADPVSASGGNYHIVVIHQPCKGRRRKRRRLIYAKCGSTRFIPLGNGSDKQYDNVYSIISFNGYVYGITRPDYDGNHRVLAWDFTGQEEEDFVPRLVLDFQPKVISSLSRPHSQYLVESEGELLLVSTKDPDLQKLKYIQEKERIGFRELYIHARSPDICRVYKMDFKGERWVELDSLGDRVLFTTWYQRMSLSTREFPQYEKNSIYFHHYIYLEGCAPVIGVFNLENGSMKEIDIKS